MKRKLQYFIFLILIFGGFLFASSVSATTVCPTASPLGVGCPSEPTQQYYCSGSCRLMDVGYCPTNELTPVAPCTGLDSCGACSTCQASYLLCTASAYPTRSCTYNDPALHCASLVNSNCNVGECASCTSGYSLCSTNHTCIATQSCETWETFNACTNTCEGTAPSLKLSFDSAGLGTTGTNIIQSASPVLLISPSSLVGIGTTTPTSRLEVVPATGYSILSGDYKIGNVALPTSDADAATKGYVDSIFSSSGVSLWDGSIAGNIWNLNSGNVGIGTTTPQSLLNAISGVSDFRFSTGSAALTPTMAVINSNGSGKAAGLLAGTSGAAFAFDNAGFFTIISEAKSAFTGNTIGNGTRLFTILSSGNIGIGTTNPTGKLHIDALTGGASKGLILQLSAANASAASRYVSIDFSNYTAGFVGQFLSTGSTYSNSGINLPPDSVGLFAEKTAGSLVLAAAGTSGDMRFNTGGYPLANERMRITSAGNVGIGTTTPLARLEVVPTSAYSILAGNFKIGNVALPTADSDAATKGYVDSFVASATSSISLWDGSTAGNIWSLNSGNVGIGTSNPNYKLHLQNGDFIVRSNNGENRFYVYGGASDDLNGEVYLYDTNDTANIRINSSGDSYFNGGNLGIGTTSPGALLHISGSNSAQIATYINNNNSAGIARLYLKNDLDAGFMLTTYGSTYTAGTYNQPNRAVLRSENAMANGLALVAAAGGTHFYSGSSEYMTLTNGGNIGIGTTTPIARLEVVPASGYSILAGNFRIGNVALPTDDNDVVTLGWVNSALSSVGGSAIYATSTPSTYNGLQSGYSGANALCAATLAGTHVCTTEEILYSINNGSGSSIPVGTTLWVSNGPPAYTANANDCIGWTSSTAGNYGTVWIKLSSGDGFGSLNSCATARSYACCQ